MCLIPDNSIDMVLCDLPYGQTARNKWDTILPFDQLWFQYERVAKENAAIVLFANGMFTADLMKSNAKWWRYNLIWKKTTPTGFLNANKMPLRYHEDICVFYKKLPTYYPQKTQGNTPVHSYVKHTTDGSDYGDTKLGVSGGGSTERFPKSVLEFATDKQKAALHPTQKPVKLLEYLIRTYTNEHDLVLDNCMGSGTTAIACLNINRCFIGFESDNIFHTISENRILKEFGSECFGYKGRGSKNQ
jgi:DNA modification methylase